MEQTPKTFAPEETGVARWMGRIIVAVILGEAIWNLTVSVTNYVVVPWLGDLFGRSSNLPASFTQRPYNYPDLFVSMMEFGLAGLLAAVLNYLFERRRTQKVKLVKRPSLQTSSPQASPRSAPVEVAKVGPQPVEVGAKAQNPPVVVSPIVVSPAVVSPVVVSPDAVSSIAPVPEVKRDPVIPPPPVAEVAAAPASLVAPASATYPSQTVASTPPVASAPPVKPLPPASTAKASKPKKPKAVYYNIVGEPMPSDED